MRTPEVKMLITILFFSAILLTACAKKSPEEKVEEPERTSKIDISHYYILEKQEKPVEELSKRNIGSISVVTTLIDNTTESWSFKLLKGETDVLDASKETAPGEPINVAQGVYDIVFPCTKLVFPKIPGVKIESGCITNVVFAIPSRFTVTAKNETHSIRIYDGETGAEIGRSSNEIVKNETVVYDCLPGTYKLALVYTEDNKDDIVFEIEEGETIDIQLE
ncbi:MAG: hypothetical protein E3J78_08710 [Candidatus Cloacimonadota bacterium]|nr:MAG: hypothetical protein E3J78_08710 [Candidatus Cloacimonadota bacterium]